MISKFFKTLFNTGKKAKKSVEDSMDFIDDVLEKEYITGTLEKAKETTGDIVEGAGKLYQKTADKIDETLDKEKIKKDLDKLVEKGKEMKSELSEAMIESSETLKNVMNEGKEMIEKLFDEEE